MSDILVGFGKHTDLTLEQLFFKDPDYICWLIQDKQRFNSLFRNPTNRQQMLWLLERADNLNVPGKCFICKIQPIQRMAILQHYTGSIGRVEFVCNRCNYDGGSPAYYTTLSFMGMRHIEMFFKKYDKTGANYIVKAIKHAYFGDEHYRITQKRAREFFQNLKNFNLKTKSTTKRII